MQNCARVTSLKMLNNLPRYDIRDARIQKILKNAVDMLPHAKVYVYGSRIYHFTDESSDLNIYIDLGRMIHL